MVTIVTKGVWHTAHSRARCDYTRPTKLCGSNPYTSLKKASGMSYSFALSLGTVPLDSAKAYDIPEALLCVHTSPKATAFCHGGHAYSVSRVDAIIAMSAQERGLARGRGGRFRARFPRLENFRRFTLNFLDASRSIF